MQQWPRSWHTTAPRGTLPTHRNGAESSLTHRKDHATMADLAEMLQRLDERKGALAAYQNAWNGQQRAAFMTSASREALDARLTRLSVNFPRLVIRSEERRVGKECRSRGRRSRWR